jgi:hypothetical protein
VWPVALSGRLPVVALVGRYPTNKLIGREPIPDRKTFQTHQMPERLVSGISTGFPELSQSLGQVAHVLLTRSPLIPSRRRFTVRLACVKHAASVRPEPGSNSPLMFISTMTEVAVDISKSAPKDLIWLSQMNWSSYSLPKESPRAVRE